MWKEKDPSSYTLRMVDMRDLVRVSSSVAVVEDLLKDLNRVDKDHARSKVRLNFLHTLEPEALLASRVIRSTAEELLQRHHNQDELFGVLDATFGIYLNLGELGKAAWEAVQRALTSAGKSSSQLFNPGNMKRLKDAAKSEASKRVIKKKEKMIFLKLVYIENKVI